MVIFAYVKDHVEPKPKIQTEQVQRMLEGSQASSGGDIPRVEPRQTPMHLTTFLELYLSLYFIYDS
jgi:hypothetical protein